MKRIKSGVISTVAIGLLASSAVGVAAQQTEPPHEFSGRWAYSYDIEEHGETGGMWGYVAEEMSDPRLEGRISLAGDRSGLGEGAELWNTVIRIENEEGAWEEMPGLLVRFDEASASVRTGLFIGEGAYEGLVAVTELAWDLSGPRSAFDVRGVVLDEEDLPETVIVADGAS